MTLAPVQAIKSGSAFSTNTFHTRLMHNCPSVWPECGYQLIETLRRRKSQDGVQNPSLFANVCAVCVSFTLQGGEASQLSECVYIWQRFGCRDAAV